MPNPTLREIITAWLTANGYDGLYSRECGCRLNDLIPCDEPDINDCAAGYLAPCDPETCENGGGCEWHIGPKKPDVDLPWPARPPRPITDAQHDGNSPLRGAWPEPPTAEAQPVERPPHEQEVPGSTAGGGSTPGGQR